MRGSIASPPKKKESKKRNLFVSNYLFCMRVKKTSTKQLGQDFNLSIYLKMYVDSEMNMVVLVFSIGNFRGFDLWSQVLPCQSEEVGRNVWLASLSIIVELFVNQLMSTCNLHYELNHYHTSLIYVKIFFVTPHFFC